MSQVESEQNELLSLINKIHSLFLIDRRDQKGSDEIESLVKFVINYISHHPQEILIQGKFLKSISPEVSGLAGITLLVFICMQLSEEKIVLIDDDIQQSSPSVIEMREALKWYKSFYDAKNKDYHIGFGSIPNNKMPKNVQCTFNSLTRMADHLCNQVSDDDDIRTIKSILHVCALLARETADPNQDLHVLRVIAGKLATYHNPQIARDLAETGLGWSETNPTSIRRRIAWFTYSDIYLRCNDLQGACFGLACSYSQKTEILNIKQHLEEAYLLCRILRQMGLINHGRKILAESITSAKNLPIFNDFKHRLFHLDFTFRAAELTRDSSAEKWQSLLDELELACHNLSDNPDELYPYIVCLGQVIVNANKEHIDTTKYQIILDKYSEKYKGGMQETIKIMVANKPNFDEIKKLIKRLNSTRYSDDLANDLDLLNTVSRRYLTQESNLRTPIQSAIATELLTDMTLQPHQWGDQTGRGVVPLLDENELSILLQNLNHDGYTVHYLGFDSLGNLHRTTFDPTSKFDTQKIPDHIFSSRSYKTWKEEFPYSYGISTKPGDGSWNHFFSSMKNMHLDCKPSPKMLFIKDILLQQIPSNLFYMDTEFSGENSEVSATPSLNWLHSIRKSNEQFDEGWLVWMPVRADDESYTTLNLMYGRLLPIFTEFGVQISDIKILRKNALRGKLVIIGAHGGLDSGDDFFKIVSDEDGNYFNSIHLRDVISAKIVVLFICNAGREGSTPFRNTASSIANRLLDKGSHAVVASPWPLNSAVPVHWLPIFLDAIKNHLPVGEAVRTANLAVRSVMTEPSDWLAMAVFGDPSASL